VVLLEGPRSGSCRNDPAGVAGGVDAFALGGEVVLPVLRPVTVGADCSELEDRFCSIEGPASTRDVEPVTDEVPACPFDDVIELHLQ